MLILNFRNIIVIVEKKLIWIEVKWLLFVSARTFRLNLFYIINFQVVFCKVIFCLKLNVVGKTVANWNIWIYMNTIRLFFSCKIWFFEWLIKMRNSLLFDNVTCLTNIFENVTQIIFGLFPTIFLYFLFLIQFSLILLWKQWMFSFMFSSIEDNHLLNWTIRLLWF